MCGRQRNSLRKNVTLPTAQVIIIEPLTRQSFNHGFLYNKVKDTKLLHWLDSIARFKK